MSAADPFRRVGLGGLLIWLLATAAAMLAVAWWRGGGPPVADPGRVLSWLSWWAYGATAAWMLWALPRAGVSWRRLFGPLPRPALWIEPPLLAWLNVSFGANSLLAALWLMSHLAPEVVERGLGGAGHGLPGFDTAPLGTLWVVTVLVAPVLEELLFRGVLFHRFAGRWGVRRAAVASSLAWGVLHANPLGITVFGLLLCALYVRTRSLWLPILAHALNNAVPMLLLALSRAGGGAEPMAHDDLAAFRRAIGPILLFLAGSTALVAAYLRWRWPARDALTPYAANGAAAAEPVAPDEPAADAAAGTAAPGSDGIPPPAGPGGTSG